MTGLCDRLWLCLTCEAQDNRKSRTSRRLTLTYPFRLSIVGAFRFCVTVIRIPSSYRGRFALTW
jgi:hypothetical protein